MYRHHITFFCALFLIPAIVLGDEPATEMPTAAQLEFFETKIRPVLVQHCYKCHSEDSDSVKGGLLLDSRKAIQVGGDSGPGVVPGEPDESVVLSAMRYESFEMPPKGKLSDEVLQDFATWIKQGAADPREGGRLVSKTVIDFEAAGNFWAFQKPVKSKLPNVHDKAWMANPIDRYVAADLAKKNLLVSNSASKRVLIRRAYYDLIGLPPTIKQQTAFMNDSSPDAFAKVIETLLESKHYGERWGRHWLDVARYGEDQAHTFKARKYPRGYYYRDWVVESINADMPYNEFVVQQLAGDLLDQPNVHERTPALGFFALGPVYYAENVEKAKAAADEWDDRIDTLTRGVLGLTVSCARCHDHKYDPITTNDYYALAGVFASTKYQERPVVSQEVVDRRATADQAVRDQALEINRFLGQAGRTIRPSLTADIPAYMQTVFKWLQIKDRVKDKKKASTELLKESGLSKTLLERWTKLLEQKKGKNREQYSFLMDWYSWRDALPNDKDLSADEPHLAEVQALGEALQAAVESRLDERQELFAEFGVYAAFVAAEDLSAVTDGVIPLGNLFDDSKGVPLESALASDKYGAVAEITDLGVHLVSYGWGTRIKIGPEIDFSFAQIGSDNNKHGSVTNDGWLDRSAISTTGKLPANNGKRHEQGIGMHSNALITFDLDEIRRAGLMPDDQKFRFRVDRAGMNDDVGVAETSSGYAAVVVSKRHKDKNVMDAIIGGYVNGKKMEITFSDFTYNFTGAIPAPLKADGNFAEFDIEIPADAQYITLVTTGAGEPVGNTINSDHMVFSGVRIEMSPLPETKLANAEQGEKREFTESDRQAALLLSQMLYDEGLLALPNGEVEKRLPKDLQVKADGLRAAEKKLKDAVAAIQIPLAHSLTDGDVRDMPIYVAGDPGKKGMISPRALPAIFTGGESVPFKTQGSGRLELAQSLASSENPLTARVMVNRMWASHFGRGLVGTTSNFGELGERPTHPELLDYLAVEFMENNWSLKHMHRLIMNSQTYQQCSDFREAPYEVDPDNRFLWRMNRKRLEVEPWRDGLLYVSGELDLTFGGPSKELDDIQNKRRTMYGFVSRHRLNELLRLFDFPDPNITSAARSVTTVPLQQLFVLNSDFMSNRAKAFAERVQKQADAEVPQQITYAFELLYGRKADEQDIISGIEFLEAVAAGANMQSAWEQYSLALLSANEFLFVD
jgi:hypothetical protein